MINRTLTIWCALAALSASAAADLVCLPEVFNPQEKRTVNLELGYATKYVERGLALRDAETDSVFRGALTGGYALSRDSALIGGIKVDYFARKGFDHHDESSPLCDEGSVLLQYAARSSENTAWALGYQFVHGGLPGYLHSERHHGGRYIFNSQRPEEHSVVLDIHHDFAGLKGLFWDSRTQYAFRWEDGWYFSNTLGYKHELSACTSAVLEVTWTATCGYFEHHHRNSNGTQGWVFSLSLPTELSEKSVFTPFVSCVLAGNGADAAGDFYRDHTVVFGANVAFEF
ncbi:MAG: hypothetical protein IJB00_03560 [Akkermansia sp.]|nr:hypothetical protein [Akkermansia sp.]